MSGIKPLTKRSKQAGVQAYSGSSSLPPPPPPPPPNKKRRLIPSGVIESQ